MLHCILNKKLRTLNFEVSVLPASVLFLTRKETRNHPSKETSMCTTGYMYVKIGEGARESFNETNMLLNILFIKQNNE